MSNTKAHADNNEQEITLVFSKKKLLGAALSFIAYTAIVVLAVAYATKSDGTSTPNMTSKASSLSSPLSSSIMDVGGSNTAIENSGGFSSSNQATAVNNNENLDTTANNIVATTTNDLPVSAYYGGTTSKYSRASSKTSKKDSKSSKANPVCGTSETPACVLRLGDTSVARSSGGYPQFLDFTLYGCLGTRLPGSRTFGNQPDAEVVAYTNSEGNFTVKKVTYPTDGDDYYKALYGGTGNAYGERFPAAIVYAENLEEVKTALQCATENGYNVSPRGRGHHFQGMSNMDGQVVIDLSLLCNVNEFEIVEPLEEGWLLPGQKWLKSIKSSAGCTNGVMLAYNNATDEGEGGIYGTGSCPSVGITGFVTGGGSGFATPWIGWASDDLIEAEVLLANGSVVTANKHNEYSDLFWAIRGGGSGFGVILNLTRAVIQSPEPKIGTTRKFTVPKLTYSFFDVDPALADEKRIQWFQNFQDFLYENPESSKFGGSGDVGKLGAGLSVAVFLGGYEEFIHVFGDADLLDTTGVPSGIFQFPDDTPLTLPEEVNPTGTVLFEFDSYIEAVIFSTCDLMTSQDSLSLAFIYAAWSLQNNNWCDDLDIPQAKCVDRSFDTPTGPFSFKWLQAANSTFHPCFDEEVIAAFADKLSDPTSVLSRGGSAAISSRVLGQSAPNTLTGGIMIPKIDNELWNKIVKEIGSPFAGVSITHLQHGAASVPKPDDTANALRDVAIMTSQSTSVDAFNIIANTLVNEHKPYKGEPSAVQGYVNYPTPIGNPNYKKFYYGDNVERLSKIKRKYDPRNVFLQPLQIPAADEE